MSAHDLAPDEPAVILTRAGDPLEPEVQQRCMHCALCGRELRQLVIYRQLPHHKERDDWSGRDCTGSGLYPDLVTELARIRTDNGGDAFLMRAHP